MERRPRTPNDTFFKGLLERPAHARALVRAVFRLRTGRWPADAPPERLPPELLGPGLSPLFADALFLVGDGEESGRECIVGLEHKSGPDAGLARQVCRYGGALLEARRTGGGPPRMLFAVLYNGPGEWNPPLPELVFRPARGGRAVAVMDCVLVDVADLVPDLPAGLPALREGLGLMAMFGGGPPARGRLVAALRAVAGDGVYRERFLDYVLHALEVDRAGLVAAYTEAIPGGERELEGKMATLVEQWMAEGERRGEKRGEKRGELKGQAKALLRQLGRRFGSVPASARRRVATASATELGTWLDAVLDAKSVDSVFAASPRD